MSSKVIAMTEQRSSRAEIRRSYAELLDGIHYTGNKGPWFGTRHALIIMLGFGMSLAFATRSVFSVVLVAMTTNDTSPNINIPTYTWTNKGVILSSQMWLGIPIQLIAGPVGKIYGHKWFILVSIIVNSFLFMLIPVLAQIAGHVGVISSRFISGGAYGVQYTMGIGIRGIWIPVEERSTLGMLSYSVAFISSILSFIGAGQLVVSYWGYPGFCYIIGAFTLVWSGAWIYLVYENPAVHPRITPEERKYIETSLHMHDSRLLRPPWIKLLSSTHFWAPVVGEIGNNWIETIITQLDLLYVTKAWNIDVAESTSTLAIGPIVGLFFGMFLAPLSDYLIKEEYLRIVNARRLFQFVGVIGTSLSLLSMTWIPVGQKGWFITSLCIGNIFMTGYSVGGCAINIIDISPAFAGIIGGFSATFGQCFALVAPMTIDWIVKDESDQEQWRILFYISLGLALFTSTFFVIFATDKRKWDIDEEDI